MWQAKPSPIRAGDAEGGGGGGDVRFRCTLSGLRLEATAELRWGLGRRHSVRTACAGWPQLAQGRGRENSPAAARKTNTFSEPEPPETFHVSDKQQFRPRMSGPDVRIVSDGLWLFQGHRPSLSCTQNCSTAHGLRPSFRKLGQHC